MQIGDLEVQLVSDGHVWVDPGGPFGLVPRVLYQRVIPPNPDNLVPEMLNCLLLRSGGRTLVVDTGLGSKLDERSLAQWRLEGPGGGVLGGLARLGGGPEEGDGGGCTPPHP